MGNGQKAATRRERAQKLAAKGKDTSQKKANEAAKNIICNLCRNTFLCTSRAKMLEEHAVNKHSKTLKECFPDFVEEN